MVNQLVGFLLMYIYELTKKIPVTPFRRCGTPTDVCVVIVAYQVLLSAMRSSYDIDWHVHSLSMPFLPRFTRSSPETTNRLLLATAV